MIEKDNIQELFSKAFENQTAPVRPDLWAGVQAKMAAAGVASTATVATKGLSALTKWIIGSAAVGTVGVVTAVVALNSGEEKTTKQTDSPKEMAQNTTVTSPEEKSTEDKTWHPHTIYTKPNVVDNESSVKEFESADTHNRETKENGDHNVVVKDNSVDEAKAEKVKPEEKAAGSDHSKPEIAEKKEQKKEVKKAVPPVDKGSESTHNTPETKESINPEKAGKVTNFTNIFSPDGDYVNDKYLVKVENLVEFKMTITDQNNRMLFQTSDPNEGWDGKVGGDDAKPGSYAVFIDGRDLNGKEFHKAQIIQLVR